MADIKLKNRLGGYTTYNGVNSVTLKDTSGNDVTFGSAGSPLVVNTSTYTPVASDEGKFVVDSNDNTKIYKVVKSEGTDWTKVEDAVIPTVTFHTMLYGLGKILLFGYSSIYYSTNGKTWTKCTDIPSNASITSACFGNNRFVCVGSDSVGYYSIDGEHWTATVTSGNFNGVVYGNGMFLAVGTHYDSSTYIHCSYSNDGITWSSLTDITINSNAYKICYGNNLFYLWTYDGSYSSSSYVYYSSDGSSWQYQRVSRYRVTNNISTIIYANDSGIAVVSGTSYYSRNTGNGWSGLDNSFSTLGINDIRSIVYGNGKFIAINNTKGSVYSTDNGATWTILTNSQSITSANVVLSVFANDRFYYLRDTVLYELVPLNELRLAKLKFESN